MKDPLVRIQPSDLWRWDGTVSRSTYLVWGAGLGVTKFSLDSLVASTIFHHAWSPLNYIMPGQAFDLLLNSPGEMQFLYTLLLMSLPFIWTGIVLTVRRLRDAGLPIWLCKLFFIPVANLVLFSVLCVMPRTQESDPTLLTAGDTTANALPGTSGQTTAVAWQQTDASLAATSGEAGKTLSHLANKASEGRLSDATLAILLTFPAAGVLTFLAAAALKSYGWSLFIGVPFGVGMAAATLYGRNYPRSLKACAAVAFIAVTLLGVTLFAWALEGMICILMASPIAYGLAFLGALLGWSLQKRPLLPSQTRAIMIVLVFFFPSLMGAEYACGQQAPLIAVRTTCDIARPPAEVWPNVIAFPLLPEPQELIFKLGLAYPIGATICGAGPGAVRHCNFSTGAFIEPITTWDPPRRLAFGVQSQPPPMREMSWNHEIHPAHLDGYLKIQRGEFLLVPIKIRPGVTGTRIVGTTWYANNMCPTSYWRLWSDSIMHAIHRRVLAQIKTISERR